MKFEKREKLNEIEISLLRADALPVERADRIAAAPHLLKAVRARIELEKAASETSKNRVVAAKNANKFWQPLFAFKTRLSIGFAAAIVSAILIWQFVVSISSNRAPEKLVVNNRADSLETNNDLENRIVKPNDFAAHNEPEKTTVASGETLAKTVKQLRAAIKPNAAPFAKTERVAAARAAQTKTQPRQTKPQTKPREFYQLAFAGELDANETKQIVRVKLSPGALDALGVGVPAAAAQTDKFVTADLLLGEDGVPRAIRFVR